MLWSPSTRFARLHSLAIVFFVTPQQDLSIGRVVAPVTNVSSLMQKDQVSGAMKPIDPKSPLAAQLASITMTRAEMPSDVVRLMDQQNLNVESSSSSSFNTGAAVGVPLALFFISLLLCLFYRRNPFLYTRHRDAVTHACRWILALCTCKLGAIHQQSSIVRPKSRSSFTRLENDLPLSDSDSSDAEVLQPAAVSSVSAPAPASSPSRTPSAPDTDAGENRLKPKSNVPEVPRVSRCGHIFVYLLNDRCVWLTPCSSGTVCPPRMRHLLSWIALLQIRGSNSPAKTMLELLLLVQPFNDLIICACCLLLT